MYASLMQVQVSYTIGICGRSFTPALHSTSPPLYLDLMVVVDMPKLASPIEFLGSTGTVIVLYISVLILYSTYAAHTQRWESIKPGTERNQK